MILLPMTSMLYVIHWQAGTMTAGPFRRHLVDNLFWHSVKIALHFGYLGPQSNLTY